MRLVFVLAALAIIVSAPAAQAEVLRATSGFAEFHGQAESAATPERAWRALIDVGHWWGSDHTYSGNAHNLRLDPRAGGCWCERWAGGQVEHMHVVLAMEHEGERTLRLLGGLGPLQEIGVNGVLTFTIRPNGAGSTVTMDYRVSGDSGLNLDQLAPVVDQVLSEQFGRFVRFTQSGSPD